MDEQKINYIKDLACDVSVDFMPRLYAVCNIFEMINTGHANETKEESLNQKLVIFHNTESLKALLDELQGKLDELFVC